MKDVWRVFLDANVIFSAAKSAGAVRLLLQRLREAGHRCVVDDYVVAEARHNLARKSPEALIALDSLISHLEVAAVRGEPTANSTPLSWLHEKDRPVLAAAIHLNCDALLTGDRTHFGQAYGRTFSGVTLYSPRQLAEALFGRGPGRTEGTPP